MIECEQFKAYIKKLELENEDLKKTVCYLNGELKKAKNLSKSLHHCRNSDLNFSSRKNEKTHSESFLKSKQIDILSKALKVSNQKLNVAYNDINQLNKQAEKLTSKISNLELTLCELELNYKKLKDSPDVRSSKDTLIAFVTELMEFSNMFNRVSVINF